MRRGLSWGLAVTGVLSAGALMVDDKPAKVVAAIERAGTARVPDPVPVRPTVSDAASPLPTQLDPPQIEASRRDVFLPVDPPAPPPPKVVAPPPPPPAPPPAPAAPAMNWRYMGAMVTPDGERLVMLARGDSSVLIQVGTRLEEGYVVEAIGSDAVRLVYPSLGTVVDLPIPPPAGPSR
ncbi:MAG TPA: hypothetical protein VF169_10720 [Albitalea sp.]|uniref:hypothetical protein n=1 Tax=Piscinibacter sp. TaxID=1903157 RepID=UPI002ED3A331